MREKKYASICFVDRYHTRLLGSCICGRVDCGIFRIIALCLTSSIRIDKGQDQELGYQRQCSVLVMWAGWCEVRWEGCKCLTFRSIISDICTNERANTIMYIAGMQLLPCRGRASAAAYVAQKRSRADLGIYIARTDEQKAKRMKRQ